MSEEEKKTSELFGGGQVTGVYNDDLPEFVMIRDYMMNPTEEKFRNIVEVINSTSEVTVVNLKNILNTEPNNLTKEEYDRLSFILVEKMKFDFTDDPKYEADRKKYSSVEENETNYKIK